MEDKKQEGDRAASLLRIVLADVSLPVVEAWREAFEGCATQVDIVHGSILDQDVDAVVSPANSFGFMDGGIDLAYSKHFGWSVQSRLQEEINDSFEGELLVGQAWCVPTNDVRIRYVIAAPTMRVPSDVGGTVNAFLACRAALRAAVVRDNIDAIAIPGLATGCGRMPPERSAWQMRAAVDTYLDWKTSYTSWTEAAAAHRRLLWGEHGQLLSAHRTAHDKT